MSSPPRKGNSHPRGRLVPQVKNPCCNLLNRAKWLCIYSCIILYQLQMKTDLCGCEAWSLTFREERRLRVFENRMVRRIFGTKSYGVRGDCRQ